MKRAPLALNLKYIIIFVKFVASFICDAFSAVPVDRKTILSFCWCLIAISKIEKLLIKDNAARMPAYCKRVKRTFYEHVVRVYIYTATHLLLLYALESFRNAIISQMLSLYCVIMETFTECIRWNLKRILNFQQFFHSSYPKKYYIKLVPS